MAPLVASRSIATAFPQRKLRSSSLATPKKLQENLENSPVKKRGGSRSRRQTENNADDSKLRGVVTPTKKLRQPASSPLKCSPLKAIQLNKAAKSLPCSPIKNKGTPVSSAKRSLFRADLSRLAQARSTLSLSTPDQMVGRDKQLKDMREFLEVNLTKKSSKKKQHKRSLYVSGPPGTGKTTCLKRLLAELSSSNVARTVFVNCMTLGKSGGIFTKVAEALMPHVEVSGGCAEAQRLIELEVVQSKKTILLVLDEVDQLDSKSQEVLYTLFEWPYLQGSKLVLVGIANALDLTDRILPRLRMRESFCPAELTFPAYSRSEIVSILRSRLADYTGEKPIIQPKAIEFLAGKISALSGDVRKALDVCRRAIELTEIETRKQTLLKPLDHNNGINSIRPIDVPHILKIVNEIYCSSVNAAMNRGSGDDLPVQQKLLVASLLLMTNSGKAKEVTLGKLHETYARVCKKRSMAFVDLGEAGSMCSLLESRGFLAIKKGGPWKAAAKDQKLSLRIDEDEVEAALKDKTLLSGILRDVECVAK